MGWLRVLNMPVDSPELCALGIVQARVVDTARRNSGQRKESAPTGSGERSF